jgi:hypothetical protein
MMPPLHSSAEQRMTGAFNVKTRIERSLGAGEAELVATGVWVVQGQPGRCNVFLIENPGDEGGVTLYDAGARTMTRAVASAGAKLGGITRVVLGHGHTDHRGVAPALGVPAFATGRPTSRGCRRPSARSTACCTVTLGTAGRCRSRAPSARATRSQAFA